MLREVEKVVEVKESEGIPKRVAAVEVMRWVKRTMNASIIGLAVMLIIMGLLVAGFEAYAFIVTIGAMNCFIYYIAVCNRMARYLKERYSI